MDEPLDTLTGQGFFYFPAQSSDLDLVYGDGRQQLWLNDPQSYAIDQVSLRRQQALARYGEYSIFLLMWRLADHTQGLVQRCSTCWGDAAEVYGQATREKCPNCFATTFEGGYKARIIRMALWDANESDDRSNKRGDVEISTASIQTTEDFRLRNGDFIIRADGTRWRVQTISTNHLRTGFMHPSLQRTPVGFNYGQVVREDESSVAYIIDPSPTELGNIDLIGARYPHDFSWAENVRGPILPDKVVPL